MCIPAHILLQATGITCNSRDVKPGYIFVAIHGRATNGNLFIQDALARGAIAIVTDEGNPTQTALPIFQVDNARQALAQLASEYYCHPSRELKLIGVTGTNGKTTITAMLEHIFCHHGLTAGSIGTVQVNLGKASLPSTLTTPDAAALQYYLRQMRQNGVTHAAMEVSAQGIDMHRADYVNFSCGILSNITPDHLDFHGDYAAYIAAKKIFLNLLTPATPLIVNGDDCCCKEIASHYTGPVFHVSLTGSDADLRANMITTTAYGSRTLMTVQNDRLAAGSSLAAKTFELKLSVPGRHNVENALLAIAAARLAEIPLNDICTALAEFKSVDRRMTIFHLEGRTMIDDTALNPGSIAAVFDTIGHLRYHRLIVANAIRGNRGQAINAVNAATLASQQRQLPFHLIVTSAADSVSHHDQVSADEKAAFIQALDNADAAYVFTESLPEALQLAFDSSLPGDLVVLLGAQGMDAGHRLLTQLISSSWSNPALSLFRPLL